MKQPVMMTASEELALIARWRDGDSRARDRLIVAHQPLVTSMVRPFRRHSTEDLMQEGNAGLMLALHKFDPTLGHRFNTYARWWIKAAITEYINDSRGTIYVPRPRPWNPPREPLHYVPMDKIAGRGPETIAEILPSDQPSPEDIAVRSSEDRRVRASMQKLQERTRYVIEQRMADATLQDIAEVIGVTRERVRQIEARAMRSLKADLTMPRQERRA